MKQVQTPIHSETEFDLFVSQLLPTNARLEFYTDFAKCYDNVRQIEVKLHTLDYLIGKTDLEEAVRDLWNVNPSVFTVLNLLIAVRTRDKKLVVNKHGEVQPIETYTHSLEGVVEFIRETGLAEVLRLKQISSLVDYVFGVEVGLDSNARKNRSGDIMEEQVAEALQSAGIDFHREVYSRDFPEVYKALGVDSKRFDFVIPTDEKTYLVEVNFYSRSGSKLNEVARAYTELAPKINACKGYEFVWITDGVGWHHAKGKLREAFYRIPRIYNLTTLEDFVQAIQANCSNR